MEAGGMVVYKLIKAVSLEGLEFTSCQTNVQPDSCRFYDMDIKTHLHEGTMMKTDTPIVGS